jgi:hypothetical protein
MRNHYGVLVLVALVLTWLSPLSALAHTQRLVEGIHYGYEACPQTQDNKSCVRLKNRGMKYQIDAQSFAELFGIDAFELRKSNPESTIAVCRNQYDRTKWNMAPIRSVQERATDVIWSGCPLHDRRVVTVPGERFVVPAEIQIVSDSTVAPKPLSLTDILYHEAQKCNGDESCIAQVRKNLFPDTSVTQQQSTPPPPPSHEEDLQKNNGGSNRVPVKDHLAEIVLAVLLAISLFTVLLLLRKNRDLRAELVSQKKLNASNIMQTLGRARVNQGKMIELEYTQEQLQTAHDVLEEIATMYAPSLSIPETLGPSFCHELLRGIENEIIEEILRYQTKAHGITPDFSDIPVTREQAWSDLFENFRNQARVYALKANQVIALLEPKSSLSKQAMESVFLVHKLDHATEQIQLVISSMKDELPTESLDDIQSSNPNLIDMTAGMLQRLTFLKGKLSEAARNVETQEQEESGIKTKDSATNHASEESPSSKPGRTLTGLPTPAPSPPPDYAPPSAIIQIGSTGTSR